MFLNFLLKETILFCSILFYSILFYSVLFYSILFYSILFYSILSVCRLVCRFVCRFVCRPVCLNFLKGRELSFPCSYPFYSILVSDFNHQLAKIHEQYAEDTAQLVENFRKRTSDVLNEGYMLGKRVSKIYIYVICGKCDGPVKKIEMDRARNKTKTCPSFFRSVIQVCRF